MLIVLAVVAVVIFLVVPAMSTCGRARGRKYRHQNSRGIIQNAIGYAASNNGLLPLKQDSPMANNTQRVFERLLKNGLSPELLRNPVDQRLNDQLPINGANLSPIPNAPIGKGDYSYSWMQVHGNNYIHDTNTLTPLIADRETNAKGTPSAGGNYSVWKLDVPGWEGEVGWGDGHSSHETTKIKVTSYSTAVDIFDTAATAAGSNALVYP